MKESINKEEEKKRIIHGRLDEEAIALYIQFYYKIQTKFYQIITLDFST